MKKLTLFLVLLAVFHARADSNLLQNGDFADGIAHWEGDCHSADTGVSVDLTSTQTAPPSGVVVKLRHSDWTKVTQDFDGNIGQYLLTIRYSVSPDLKFSVDPEDYGNVPAKVGFSILSPFSSDPGKWALVINDLGARHYNYWTISPNLTVSGIQNLTAHVSLDSDDSNKKGFFLLFPPGDGIITLQSITLAPATGSSP